MLRTRILTAAVLIPLVVAGVLYLPFVGFAGVWGAIILLGAWEWAALAGLTGKGGRALYTAGVAGVVGGMWYLAVVGYAIVLDNVVWPTLVFWLVLSLLLRKWPDRLVNWRPPAWVRGLLGVFVLSTAWLQFTNLRVNFGPESVLYLLALVWVADVAAYFVGKAFGQTKLVPAISPGKTAEGLYGAVFASVLLALGVAFVKGFEGLVIGDFVGLSLVTVLLSVCGDLLESVMKRWAGVKDSGGLLPGHGGVLDRIDSLTAAAPVFYGGLYLAGLYFGEQLW